MTDGRQAPPKPTLQELMALPEGERDEALAAYARQMSSEGLTEELLQELQALVDQISAMVQRR